MLPKTKRVKATDFKGTKTRLVYRGAFFDISTAPTHSPESATKFACVIAKKRIKRAVDRNRAKRKIYTQLAGIQTKTPMLIFIYPTKHILQAPSFSIKEEITKAFATL